MRAPGAWVKNVRLLMNLRSFRTRLILLVLLVFIPSILLVFLANIQRQRAEREKVKTEAVLAAKLAAASQQYYLRQARQLLATMTQFDFLVLATNQPYAERGMANLKLLSPDFTDFGLIETNGAVFCHTLGTNAVPTEILAPGLVDKILDRPRFVMSGLHYDAEWQQPTLQFAYPVLDSRKNFARVMYASLKLPLLSKALEEVPLPEGGVVSVTDGSGRIVAAYPDPHAPAIATKLESAPSLQQALAQSTDVFEARSPDGNRTVNAVSTVEVGGAPLLFIQVAVPRKLLFAEADAQFGGSLLGMLLVGCVVLAGSRWFARRAFLQPVSAMLGTTERLIHGDLSARTGIHAGTTELHLLAQRFDVMAESLAKRQQDLQAANHEIKKNNLELEQRVQARTTELQFLNQELEAFSYSVSHDLRAPIRHIDGFSSILASDAAVQSSPDTRRYLALITKSAKHMGSLIDNLLAFSKMARQSLVATPVDFQEMVKCIVEDKKVEYPARNIVWNVSSLPRVQGDAGLLRQVWLNLIENAIKYTRDRDPATIDIFWREETTELVFIVRDNGVGFDMTYAQKLFGVFQRLHRQDEFEGTGIGLANVRRIIQRHGGRAWADAQKDQGAAFYFSLPKNPPPAITSSEEAK